MVQLRIYFLGTSAATPTRNRGLSCTAVLRGDELFIFDCGEGAQRSLIASNLGLNRRTKVFITHMHGDHCIGILGLIQSMTLAERYRPLEIVAPPGFRPFLRANIRHLNLHPSFELGVTTATEGIVVREKDYTVRACKSEHSITSFAYRLDELPRPGRFYPERAMKLGVPMGRLWSQLQHGRSVTIGTRIFKPSDVLGEPRSGRTIGISGDTRVNRKLRAFFKGVDILIFDSTYSDSHREKAVQNFHSTAKEAAELARDAGCKRLVLTHFSARYEDISTLLKEANSVHPSVLAAEDMMSIDLPYGA